MKPTIAFVLASGLIFAGSAGHADETEDLQALQGVWVVVAAEQNGIKMTEDQVRQSAMVLTIKDKTMATTRGDKTEAVSFVLRSSTRPKEIDTVDMGGEKKDGSTLGVYSLDADNNLKLCMRSGAKGRPTGFNTKNKSGDMTLVLRRQN
jgi:uncharacterized protein (TIGR03067 family)